MQPEHVAFLNDILKLISWMKGVFWVMFHWSLLEEVQYVITCP